MFKKLQLLCVCVGMFFLQGCQNLSNVTDNESTQAVTIRVDCSTILNNYNSLKPGYEEFVPSDGIIIAPLEIPIKEGDSVLDTLKKAASQEGIALNIQGGYVESIGNLPQFVCGDASGWMYSVNGEYVNQSASRKTVEDGDEIEWLFTCSNGRDILF